MFDVKCYTVNRPCHMCLTANCMSLDLCRCTCHTKCRCSICKFRLKRNKLYTQGLRRKDSVLSASSSTTPSIASHQVPVTSGYYAPLRILRQAKEYTSSLLKQLKPEPNRQ